MTTIILTIIGILLAAAAALMVIFYGGDAFNSGSVGAQANTYQNAGTNVISAVQLAKADAYDYTNVTGKTPLEALSNPGTDNDYLKNVVSLPNGDTGTLSGTRYSVTITGTNKADVCARINKNLKLSATPAADTIGNFKMGCVPSTTPTFFANA